MTKSTRWRLETRRAVYPSGSRPRPLGGGFGRGLLLGGFWLSFATPLGPTTGSRHPSSWGVTEFSLFQDKREILDNLQPLDIVVRSDAEIGGSGSRPFEPAGVLLLRIPCMCTIPPRQAHDNQERPFGSTGEDVGPLSRTLRWVLSPTAPLGLDLVPPVGNFDAETRDGEGITSSRLVCILEILLDLGRPVLVREGYTL